MDLVPETFWKKRHQEIYNLNDNLRPIPIKVLLEVGHGRMSSGQFDPGAVNTFGIREYDLNWILCNSARSLFAQFSVHCDVTDANLGNFRNGLLRKGYDVFVSVHHNSFNNQAQGSEVIIHDSLAESQDFDLGAKLSRAFSDEFGIRDRGVKKRNLAVLRGAEIAEEDKRLASVLIEPYFMDSISYGGSHQNWSYRAGRVLARTITNFHQREVRHG